MDSGQSFRGETIHVPDFQQAHVTADHQRTQPARQQPGWLFCIQSPVRRSRSMALNIFKLDALRKFCA